MQKLVYLTCLFITLATTFYTQAQADNWNLFIKNDIDEWLPFRISFKDVQGEKYLNIKNAEEVIQLKPSRTVNDTTFYHFIDYNAEICFTPSEENILTGYWVNFEKEPVAKRPIRAELIKGNIESTSKETMKLDGRWKTDVILPDRSYDAELVFTHQQGDVIYGTIRTNAGDYRFLEGKVEGNNFYLSNFMGNSIFQITGEWRNDTIFGVMHTVFRSNIHTISVQDADFALKDPLTATKIINDKPFNLDLKDENGKQHIFNDLIKDKVAIVTIFGTWCPNCIDELNYFKELQQKFPDLAIVTVAFETSSSEEVRKQRVKGFKQRRNVDMLILVAGTPVPESVFSYFPMIDSFSSYPTSFLLDKNGKIVSTHTGFDGPATGSLFDEYKEHLEGQIRELMK